MTLYHFNRKAIDKDQCLQKVHYDTKYTITQLTSCSYLLPFKTQRDNDDNENMAVLLQ